MKINISQVRQLVGDRQPFRFILPVRELIDVHDPFWMNGDIQVAGEVVNDGRVFNVAGLVTGSVDTNCHRCLKQFTRPVSIPFAESYRPEDSTAPSGDDAADAFFTVNGDEIDITQLIRETLLLSEPLKIVCADTCKGLCLLCGADLNTAPCDCDRDIIDPRLASLKKLLDKK